MNYFPLTPIFCNPKDKAEELAWANTFIHDFGISPSRFKQNEAKLKERCNKYSVVYISLRLGNSVDRTRCRRLDLNKKFKAVTDKIRWNKLSVGKQKSAKARMKRNWEEMQLHENTAE